VAICLNPRCQQIVPNESAICSHCGGKEISEFRRFASVEKQSKELTMENFEKITSKYEPIREHVHVPHSGNGSRKSKIAVRLQYFKRRIFFRFHRPKNQGW
jgi:CO dehydrogenase/acetyl-CoA synthase delta subunit